MDLYALPPAEFTAARDALVKQARRDGDRGRAAELGALRRPTASAHAVNALVRAEPDLLTELLSLGAQLAQAQQAGRGGALRELGEQRRQLVEAVADRAVAAGGPLTAAGRNEVVATLEAALADPATGEAVRTGRLVRAVSYAGFGAVDLDGAVADLPEASPGAGPAPSDERPPATGDEPARQATQARRKRQRAAEVLAAEQAALDAAGGLDDAVAACEQAQAAADLADAELERAGARVHEAEQELGRAREGRDEAEVDRRRIAREAERRTSAVRAAQQVADRARAALDRLRREG